MDQQFYNQQPYNQPYNPMPPRDRRSSSMETASLVLGLISLTTCSCLYISIACGALAILLGLAALILIIYSIYRLYLKNRAKIRKSINIYQKRKFLKRRRYHRRKKRR